MDAMFSLDDLEIEDASDLIQFLPIVIFIGLVAPFLLLAYSIGFFLKTAQLLD